MILFLYVACRFLKFTQQTLSNSRWQYQEAAKSLASAQKLEPKNKQIKQALQFAEVRMTQEMRKRMG